MKEKIIMSLFMVGALVSAFVMNQKLNHINHEVERVQVKTDRDWET